MAKAADGVLCGRFIAGVLGAVLIPDRLRWGRKGWPKPSWLVQGKAKGGLGLGLGLGLELELGNS